eukprot:CAMPEP_0204822884 /NCGR_PEP_ID=MMETSP1346-20131115/1065_1 /ASSEMBLY_ACC=CAM_ASM_000771 /TAXON_ID=215587 /ORGANISM="Aplanochytrium stocchinoi, Strain GSBS06" /LENGTH=168 /DNA_ID=CAMNT_0051949339 /DNA_START=210 /DNA_END=716 /DNA_ORIENTATION=-
MLGVGFKIGTSRKIEEGLSEFDSIKRMEKMMEKANIETKPKIKPSAPPTVLARRALGYATLLTLSSATMIGIGVGWYMGVNSFQEWSDRMKDIVPAHSKRIEDKMGPALDNIRDKLNGLFSRLTPVLVKGRQDRTHQQLDDERKELEEAGIDPSIIDPLPEKNPRKQS